MTQLFKPFNPLDHNPEQSGGQLPVGKHPVIITGAELKENSKKDGGYVEFDLQITDGPQKGTTGVYRLNLYNPSPKAVEIAHSQLSALCHVTKQFQLGSDGTQLGVLFNIPFIVEVALQKGDDKYTEVKKLFDIQGNEPGKPPTNAQAAQTAPQANQGNWGGNPTAGANSAPAATNPAANGGNWGAPAGGNAAPAQTIAAPTENVAPAAGGRPSWAS